MGTELEIKESLGSWVLNQKFVHQRVGGRVWPSDSLPEWLSMASHTHLAFKLLHLGSVLARKP